MLRLCAVQEYSTCNHGNLVPMITNLVTFPSLIEECGGSGTYPHIIKRDMDTSCLYNCSIMYSRADADAITGNSLS